MTDGYRRFYLTTARVNNVHRRSQASHLVNSARRAGVLIGATGPGANVLKIRPPLVFKKEHAEILVDTLANILSARPWMELPSSSSQPFGFGYALMSPRP